jgi:hypothetical protein
VALDIKRFIPTSVRPELVEGQGCAVGFDKLSPNGVLNINFRCASRGQNPHS